MMPGISIWMKVSRPFPYAEFPDRRVLPPKGSTPGSTALRGLFVARSILLHFCCPLVTTQPRPSHYLRGIFCGDSLHPNVRGIKRYHHADERLCHIPDTPNCPFWLRRILRHPLPIVKNRNGRGP